MPGTLDVQAVNESGSMAGGRGMLDRIDLNLEMIGADLSPTAPQHKLRCSQLLITGASTSAVLPQKLQVALDLGSRRLGLLGGQLAQLLAMHSQARSTSIEAFAELN